MKIMGIRNVTDEYYITSTVGEVKKMAKEKRIRGPIIDSLSGDVIGELDIELEHDTIQEYSLKGNDIVFRYNADNFLDTTEVVLTIKPGKSLMLHLLLAMYITEYIADWEANDVCAVVPTNETFNAIYNITKDSLLYFCQSPNTEITYDINNAIRVCPAAFAIENMGISEDMMYGLYIQQINEEPRSIFEDNPSALRYYSDVLTECILDSGVDLTMTEEHYNLVFRPIIDEKLNYYYAWRRISECGLVLGRGQSEIIYKITMESDDDF